MLSFNLLQKKFTKTSRFLLILVIISWIFSGWPQIYNFPPKVPTAQASTATAYATSNAADGALTGWTNPTYAYTDDGTQFATRAGTTKNQWYGTLYGFDLSSIPDNSTINSVTITAEWKNSTTDTSGPVLYLGTQSGGSEVGTGTSDTTGQTPFEVVTKVPTGLTAANLKATGASGFWAILRFRRTDNTTHTASVDYVKVVVDYTPPVVDTPTFTDATGTYNNDLSETITVASPSGATICYTTNGDTPAASTPGTCSTGSTYSGPVSITATGTTLKAIGTKVGYTNSAVQSATYTLQVADPSFGTNGGSFNNDTSTTFSSTTTGAVFCSTLDGSTPAASTPGTCSAGATGASATVIATGTAVKVLGTKANYVNSAVQTSNTFTLTVGTITSSPGAGTYGSAQSVTLDIATTTGAVAHYTINGDAVTCSSTTYSGAFNVSVTTTVKAIGCKTNYASSATISDLYTININEAPNAPSQDSPPNSTTNVSVTPTFLMTATDPDGDAVNYKVTIYSNEACSTTVSTHDQSVTSTGWSQGTPYASGVQGSFTLQSGDALSNHTQYWWKASAKDPGGTGNFTDSSTCNTFTTAFSTTIDIRAQNYTTAVSTITFSEGASGTTVSEPYNNIDGSGNPQIFGGAGTAKPVVTLYNGGSGTLTIWYNITTFTNSVASSEYYLVNTKGAACTNASCITQAVTFDTDITTGSTIVAGAGNEKDFYLKLNLGTPAGKSGTSSLTILGEAL